MALIAKKSTVTFYFGPDAEPAIEKHVERVVVCGETGWIRLDWEGRRIYYRDSGVSVVDVVEEPQDD